MLIQLLEILKKGKSCTLQELAEQTGEDLESVKMKIEYLENNGYLIKTKKSEVSQCKSQCSECSNCIVNQDETVCLMSKVAPSE